MGKDGGAFMEEFKFTTKTNFEVFRDYWMFTLFEKRGANGGRSGFVKYMTILLVIVAALAVLCICNAVLLDGVLGPIPLILLIGIAAALISALVTATRSQPKRQYKLVQEAVETPQKYTFTDTQMEVREDITEEDRESLAEFPYEKIISGYETQKAFYLFISETEAFLIPRGQLTGVDAGEFAAFLARKLDGRFFKSKKS